MLVDNNLIMDTGAGETLTLMRHAPTAIDMGAAQIDLGSGEDVFINFTCFTAMASSATVPGATHCEFQAITSTLPLGAQQVYSSTSYPAATDVLTTTAVHTLPTGMPVVVTGGGGAAEIVRGTTYYVIRLSTTTMQLALTLEQALAGAAIDVSADATGTLTITANPNGLTADLSTGGAVNFNVTADTVTLANHGLVTGQRCFLYCFGGTLAIAGIVVAGLTTGAPIYAIRVDANTFKLATSLANALAGTAADITVDTSANQPTTLYVPPYVVASSGPIPKDYISVGTTICLDLSPKWEYGIASGAGAIVRPGMRHLQARYVPLYGETRPTATVTGATATNLITWTAHGLTTGTPVVFTGGGGMSGVKRGIVYYVITLDGSANTFKIATSLANALAGTVNALGSDSTPTVTAWACVNPGVVPGVATAGLFKTEVVLCGNQSRKYYPTSIVVQ